MALGVPAVATTHGIFRISMPERNTESILFVPLVAPKSRTGWAARATANPPNSLRVNLCIGSFVSPKMVGVHVGQHAGQHAVNPRGKPSGDSRCKARGKRVSQHAAFARRQDARTRQTVKILFQLELIRRFLFIRPKTAAQNPLPKIRLDDATTPL